MNAVIETIYRSGQVEDAQGVPHACFPLSVPAETGAFLHDLVSSEGFERTLETGMAYGLSMLHICQAHRERGRGTHTAIDPRQVDKWGSIGLLNARKAGFEDILEFRREPSHAALPTLLAEGRRFDFAFIDGLHLFDYALVDFFYIDKMLEIGGIVCIDDLWMPAMRRAIAFILANRGYVLVRPRGAARAPAWKRAARVGRRFLQEPFGGALPIKLLDGNVCAMRKRCHDDRTWQHFRPF